MATVKVDQSSAGSTVRIAMGDIAELILPETRTAGYSWKVVSAESPMYDVKDEGFKRASGVGGAGEHRWAVTAAKAGSAEFELAYGRSWESDAGKRFTVTIEVRK
jgi:predicted secreted protein